MPPTRSNSLLLERAQQLHLHLDRDLADLVEEERALVGELEAPGLAADRAGEGALLVAEELALDEVRGMAAQFTRMKGLSRARCSRGARAR
jgi:hypothetical protein